MKKHTAPLSPLSNCLIVITIIAVLASIALPAYNGVKERGDQTKDLLERQAGGAGLRQFAIDNNRSLSGEDAGATDYSAAAATQSTTSNEAFWWLFPNICRAKRFSPFPDRLIPRATPDNKLDPAGTQTRTDTLKKGENTFAYVSGLTDTSNSDFSANCGRLCTGSPGYVYANKAQPGGVWSGKKAIVVFCDASGQIMKVDATSLKICVRAEVRCGSAL